MRITHLNTYESSGGAARAAGRLHEGLRLLGHDSRLLVAQADSQKDGVVLFAPPAHPAARLGRIVRRYRMAPAARRIAARPAGSNFFSDDRSLYRADVLRQLPPSDVLHLHWVSGFVDYREFFAAVPGGVPLVWTLHDMNPFTGGCHTDAECGKFKAQCGACPQIHSTDPNDLSAQIWKRKQDAYRSIRPEVMQIVTPSRWMAAEVKQSALLGHFPVSVIPYGLDTRRFRPRSRTCARELFGIPADARVVLFVAAWATEKQKGLNFLLEALAGMETVPSVHLLVVGRGAPAESLGPRAVVLDCVRDDLLLSQVYSAADVFVAPSLQDNFPNTALEAMACGTPVIAFSVGGLPDIVREGQTGALVPRGDTRALRQAISGLLQNPERRAVYSEASRRTALQEYALEVQAGRYVELYARLTAPSPVQ